MNSCMDYPKGKDHYNYVFSNGNLCILNIYIRKIVFYSESKSGLG